MGDALGDCSTASSSRPLLVGLGDAEALLAAELAAPLDVEGEIVCTGSEGESLDDVDKVPKISDKNAGGHARHARDER